jgi:hypothetical protein
LCEDLLRQTLRVASRNYSTLSSGAAKASSSFVVAMLSRESSLLERRTASS